MAKVTCKKFTYAKYASGGNGSAVVYTGGVMLDDYLAKAEVTVDRTDGKEFADGKLIDSEKIATAAHMVMELVNNNEDIRKDVLGYEASGEGTSAELLLTENDPPFVGAGCLMANRYKGVITWEGYWLYKASFSSDGDSAETRRDSTTWQHTTITGDAVGVTLAADGKTVYLAHKSGMTESAAVTWLRGHAGITGT